MGMPKTKNGHDMFLMASLFQKAIRRSDAQLAGYAANELFTMYYTMLWNRIMVIAAEDIYDHITHELAALRYTCESINKNKAKDKREKIFISKAIVILLQAKKNRDGDYFACVCMRDTQPELRKKIFYDTEQGTIDIDKCLLDKIPAYAYDKHTYQGKAAGKTSKDFDETEQAALKPLQVGLFDYSKWTYDEKGNSLK